MAQTQYRYPVDLTPDEDGWWLVGFPDVPAAHTGGPTREAALEEAADCLEEALAGRIARREAIPAASPARGRPTTTPGALIAAKVALYEAVREAGLTTTALAARLGVQETEARRMLDPRHATKIGRLEWALARMGRRVVLTVESG